MKSLTEALEFLYSLQKSGMKFGLRNIRALLRAMGNPERALCTIHIAGSNGKGSTAAMIASVLTASGYRTGLYTSPHLVSFSERIRINGHAIGNDDIVRLTSGMRKHVIRLNATFFEAVTALAFRYFCEKRIEFGVIETGLGGRLDATNVLHPRCSVITNISREHTHILGNSVGKIAYEKAGIIKRGVPCVTGAESPAALKVIHGQCLRKKTKLLRHGVVGVEVVDMGTWGAVLNVDGGGWKLDRLEVELPGRHQIRNAQLALTVLGQLRRSDGIVLKDAHVRSGFAQTRKLSGISSRLTVIQNEPRIITDVAHNPDAISALVDALLEFGIGQVVLVFGVMRDKDHRAMVKRIAPIVSNAVVVSPTTERAADVSLLRIEFEKNGVSVGFAGQVGPGVDASKRIAGKRTPILITGSHFVVGEALAHLGGKKYLTINQ